MKVKDERARRINWLMAPYSGSEIAEMIGVPKSTACSWKDDPNRMRAPALLKLIEKLDLTPDELFVFLTGRRRG